MNADFQKNLNKVPVTELSAGTVSLGPGPFTMSYGFDLDLMKASLKTGGLLNPPLLLKSGAGDFLIVSGYRRITALLELGHKHLPARILEEDQISFLDALLINFYDNLATREFNPVEKGMVLARLAGYLTEEQLLGDYMGLRRLSPRRSILKNYISFDRDLDEPMKQALAGGTISELTAATLLALPTEERNAVAELFSRLTFNVNQQKQLIELLADNSRITGISLAEMVRTKPFLNILASPSMNRPQKARALLALLRSWRFPRLTRAEKVFKKRVAKLKLPREVRIQPPPYFESEFYRMEISFRNGKELKDLIRQLGNIEGLQELRDPWEGGDW
ncbi:MAG: ParB/RepB/Spo0J family partition protein [Deltaproteobacteria bacterium]|nr:ParB/RepB/Spo0J family partition protein [Deltaproteobacteria bacterium]